MTVLQKKDAGSIIESVIIKGDLSKLTPQERSDYYMRVCESVGLNPLTKPFEYITLNNKLTLYALRACTDQLRTIHDVSVEELSESERDGVFIVTAKVRNKAGRTDMAKGAVTISRLQGEALANALMKAETKAKRRATLSLCGLGFLDETEIDTIPLQARSNGQLTAQSQLHPKPAAVPDHDPETGEVHDDDTKRKFDAARQWSQDLISKLNGCISFDELEIILNNDETQDRIDRLREKYRQLYTPVSNTIRVMYAKFVSPAPKEEGPIDQEKP